VKQIIGGLILGLLLVTPAIADEAKPPPAKKTVTTKKVALVDINSASQQQLEALPGVGKDYCHHIIMGRPYENTEQLVEREILPQETYDKIKDKIVAKAAKKPATKKAQ
jgi:DNA uptake protein ComE-like DNA-binding protein